MPYSPQSVYRAMQERLEGIRTDWICHRGCAPIVRFCASPEWWHNAMKSAPGPLFLDPHYNTGLKPDEIQFQGATGRIDYQLTGLTMTAWVEGEQSIFQFLKG